MKKTSSLLLIALLFDIGVHFYNPPSAAAQAPTSVFIAPQVVSSVSQCAWPTGVTVSNGVAFCFINTGVASTSSMYFALNGGTGWSPLVPPSTTGVTSFGNPPRTGAVVLTDADVQGAGVKVSTTVTSTATSTVQ